MDTRAIEAAIYPLLEKYNIDGALCWLNGGDSISLTIYSGNFDIRNDHKRIRNILVKGGWVFPPWPEKYYRTFLDDEFTIEDEIEGKSREVLLALTKAMKAGGWYSEYHWSDFYNFGYYITIDVGSRQHPYVYNGEPT